MRGSESSGFSSAIAGLFAETFFPPRNLHQEQYNSMKPARKKHFPLSIPVVCNGLQ